MLMKYLLSSLLLISGLISCTVGKTLKAETIYPIQYEVSMPEPSNHYFEITVKVNDFVDYQPYRFEKTEQ